MSGQRVNYSQLLEQQGIIQIPMIQRDYAQGRESEEEVREDFLSAMAEALSLASDDPKLPLNLDFIYGSVEGDDVETRFAPLDGQQRLTTLFLLHWFLAWNDAQWDIFDTLFLKDGHSRFTYRVRPSSTEFFDFLVTFRPDRLPAEITLVSALIRNQPGYFRSWRHDPTVQSTLAMLDAIRNRFIGSDGLLQRLTDSEKPAITFQLLPLDKFGLSDDLYIKMNARGMPLTPFETFKARYEQELKEQFEGQTRPIGGHDFAIHEFVSRRMDTAWMDLFWAECKGSWNRSSELDQSILNLFRIVAMITRDPDTEECQDHIEILTKSRPNYTTFHKKGWLDEAFTATLVPLLEAWSGDGGGLNQLLPNGNYFDERSIFSKLANDSMSLDVAEIMQFMGYAFYVKNHENDLDSSSFQAWMRVVHNLVINSTTIDRANRLPGGMKGLLALLPESDAILEYLKGIDASEGVGTLAWWQLEEESLKSGLLIHHAGWKPLIDRAELHGYLRGQIGFLLDFSGITGNAEEEDVAEWEDATHEELQGNFEEYLCKAEAMFNGKGVINNGKEFIWQRALLSVGDYLLPLTAKRYCFLTDAYTEPTSWKRYLRDENEERELLQELWDHLDGERPIPEQLREIITNADDLEPWRESLVKSPTAMAYCSRSIIRQEPDAQTYLLAKMQMNGAHAEVLTYTWYRDILLPMEAAGNLAPLEIHYHEPSDRHVEPGIRLTWDYIDC